MSTRDPRRTGEADALPRDEALSRVYREQAANREGPPATLDERILAAARQTAAGPRRSVRAALPWWRRLMVPVSVAAVLVISATLTLMVHDERQKSEAPATEASHPPPTRPNEPAQAPVLRRDAAEQNLSRATRAARNLPGSSTLSNETVAPLPTEPNSKAAEKRVDESTGQLRKREPSPAGENAAAESLPEAFPPAAPVAPPGATGSAPAKDVASGAAAASGAAVGRAATAARPSGASESDFRRLREAPPSPRSEQLAPAAAPPPANGTAAEPAPRSLDALERDGRPELRLETRAVRSAEDWLAEIRHLKRAGREAEWRDALERFRARYPDYPLPDEFR